MPTDGTHIAGITIAVGIITTVTAPTVTGTPTMGHRSYMAASACRSSALGSADIIIIGTITTIDVVGTAPPF